MLLYNGQLDIIVGAPLTENFMRQLKWSGQSDYLDSQKTVWKLNGTTVGYVRQVGSFQQVREEGRGGREGGEGERIAVHYVIILKSHCNTVFLAHSLSLSFPLQGCNKECWSYSSL